MMMIIKRSFKLGYCEGLSISRGSTGELRAGQASALVRGNACPVGPRGDGLEVSAPDAGSDGAAGEGDGLRPQAVDVVAALDARARVLDAGDEAQEARVSRC